MLMTKPSLSIIAALIGLASCAAGVRLPYVAQVNTIDRPGVVWRPLDSWLGCAALELVDKDGKTHLLSIQSVFNAGVVAGIGPPRGDMLQTFTSPSGDTIIAHECASDASPEEQIAVFRRDRAAGTWTVHAAFPPHMPGPVYVACGVSKGVDDTFLYYHFPDSRLRKVRLDSLTVRVMKHDGPAY